MCRKQWGQRVKTIVSEGMKESLSDWISVWRSYMIYICVWGLGNTHPGRVKEYRRSWWHLFECQMRYRVCGNLWHFPRKQYGVERGNFSIVDGQGCNRRSGGAAVPWLKKALRTHVWNKIQGLLKPAMDVAKLISFVVPTSNRFFLTLDKRSITELPKVSFKTLKLLTRLALTINVLCLGNSTCELWVTIKNILD